VQPLRSIKIIAVQAGLLFSSLALSPATGIVTAQQKQDQVFILNEGRYDYRTQIQVAPVTIGLYTPHNRQYRTIITINGSRFASDLQVYKRYLYVAADNKVLRYSLHNYRLLQQVYIPGCRKLGFWKNMLLVSVGDTGVLKENLLALNRHDFNKKYLVHNYGNPVYAANNLVVQGDSLYLGINNAFDSSDRKGYISVYYLPQRSWRRQINIPNANNIENMAWYQGLLVTVNNNDFTQGSMSTITIHSGAAVTKPITTGNAFTSSVFVASAKEGYMYFCETGQSWLGIFDVKQQALQKPIPIIQPAYSMARQPGSRNWYIGVTDYLSYGKVYIYSRQWVLKDSVNTGISPGAIVFYDK
jgi:hypothetical protein